MKRLDSEEIYQTTVDGTIYCFRYPDPSTTDHGKHFYGTATAWKKETGEIFTVPYRVSAEDIDQVYGIIVDRIEKYVKAQQQ